MKLGALLKLPIGDARASCRGEDGACQGMTGPDTDADMGEHMLHFGSRRFPLCSPPVTLGCVQLRGGQK